MDTGMRMLTGYASAYGITVCQAFYYYRLNRAKQDPWYLKTFVRSAYHFCCLPLAHAAVPTGRGLDVRVYPLPSPITLFMSQVRHRAFVTFQQALLFNMLYYYLASHFDDPCAFLKLTW